MKKTASAISAGIPLLSAYNTALKRKYRMDYKLKRKYFQEKIADFVRAFEDPSPICISRTSKRVYFRCGGRPFEVIAWIDKDYDLICVTTKTADTRTAKVEDAVQILSHDARLRNIASRFIPSKPPTNCRWRSLSEAARSRRSKAVVYTLMAARKQSRSSSESGGLKHAQRLDLRGAPPRLPKPPRSLASSAFDAIAFSNFRAAAGVCGFVLGCTRFVKSEETRPRRLAAAVAGANERNPIMSARTSATISSGRTNRQKYFHDALVQMLMFQYRVSK